MDVTLFFFFFLFCDEVVAICIVLQPQDLGHFAIIESTTGVEEKLMHKNLNEVKQR